MKATFTRCNNLSLFLSLLLFLLCLIFLPNSCALQAIFCIRAWCHDSYYPKGILMYCYFLLACLAPPSAGSNARLNPCSAICLPQRHGVGPFLHLRHHIATPQPGLLRALSLNGSPCPLVELSFLHWVALIMTMPFFFLRSLFIFLSSSRAS